jgi:sugar/nucleoside kinase (ribokinase family)
MDVLCAGLAVMDIIVSPMSIKNFDEDTNYLDTLRYEAGGDALNAAINMAVLGLDIVLAARIGDDPSGKKLIATAEESGVSTKNVIWDRECPTSTSIVMIDGQGNRHFAYYGACNDRLALADIDLSQCTPGTLVHVGSALALKSLDGSALAELFRQAKGRGCITSMDVTWDKDRKWFDKIRDALAFTDIFLPSLYEARFISGKEDPRGIADFFSSSGISKLAIKMGEQGCFLTDFRDEFVLPSLAKTKPVDTTGAGDAFVSGFLLGTKKNLPLKECGILGSLIAAEAIASFGATAGIRERFLKKPEEVEKLLQTVRSIGI